MKKKTLQLALTLFICCIWTGVAHAATITVNTLADSGVDAGCELREAITAANTNTAGGGCVAGDAGADVIDLSVAGTVLTTAELPQVIEDLTIDGNGAVEISGNASHRVFLINTNLFTLQDINIINGSSTFGGCLASEPGVDLNFSNVTFDSCTATNGGGAIYVSDGGATSNVTLTDVVLSNNVTTGGLGGGGIYLGNDNTLNATNLTGTNNQSTADTGSVIQSVAFNAITASQVSITGTSDFAGNYALSGGAVYLEGDNNIIDGSTFTGNTCGSGGTGGFGCAIAANGGDVDITNSDFTSNVSDSSAGSGGGGAIAQFGSGTVTVSASTFDSNSAANGGAMYLGAGDFLLETSTFINNTSSLDGGAINQADGGGVIRQSYFGSNIASQYGGAMSLANNSTNILVTVENNTFEGNQGDYGGGIITLFTTPTNIYNNTFYQNSATAGGGGGLYADEPTNVANNIFEDNSATLSGPDCQSDQIGDFVSQGSNLVSDNTDCPTIGTDIVNVSADLGALLLNGGTTLNRMPNPGSPAINAGDATYAPAVDQRGVARPNGAGDDIGSIEVILDTTAPTLAEVTAVTTPTNDTTPDYTFSSDEAGSITYGGSCASATVAAISGNNTITFNALADGTYTDCTITVTDAASNVSNVLDVSDFTIDTAVPPAPTPSSSGSPSGGCDSCGNINSNDTNTENEEGSSEESESEDALEESDGNSSAEGQEESSAPPYFIDTQQHWSDQFAHKLLQTCGINGYKNEQGELLHLFKPQQAITRAEFWTIIIKCQFGEQQNKEQSGAGDANLWAKPYLEKAIEVGLLKDENRDPNEEISRAEALAIILELTFDLKQMQEAPEAKKCSDISQDAWYAPYFNFALEKNIISGQADENGNLTGICAPEKSILRSETAKIVIEAQE